jgi:hypothetical protein
MPGSFKVTCPSCENLVLVTNQKSGAKVECPKCKYRFKAEPPAEGESTEGEEKSSAKSKEKKGGKEGASKGTKKAASGGSNKTKLVAIGAGFGGVLVLVVVGVLLFGGGGSNSSGTSKGSGYAGITPVPPPGGGNIGPGDSTTPSDTSDPNQKKDDPTKVVRPKAAAPSSDKNDQAATNLLPNDTVAVYRFALDRLRTTAPISALFDRSMSRLFQDSFGFEPERVATYYHAYVGAQRLPFGILRLAEPEAIPTLAQGIKGLEDQAMIQGRPLFAVRSNPFMLAAANTLSFRSLFGPLFDKMPPLANLPANRRWGVCLYDTQHILLGDHELLARYLSELTPRGLPKFRSEVAENPMYQTIDPQLKRLLKALGAEDATPPLVLYAEQTVGTAFSPLELKDPYQAANVLLEPFQDKTRYVGVRITTLSPRQLSGAVRIVFRSDAAAVETLRDVYAPALALATPLLSKTLESRVEFRNLAMGGSGPGGTPNYPFPTPPGGFPMPPGGFPMPPGSGTPPGGLVPPPGAPPGVGAPGVPPGVGTPGVPPGGTGSPDGAAPGEGPGVPPGYPGLPPGYPGFPGQLGQPPGAGGDKKPESLLQLAISDADILLSFDLRWSDETYRQLIAPPLFATLNATKGKMAVYAAEVPMQGLSEMVQRMVAQRKAFPAGTVLPRTSEASRYGLTRPPRSRVSFFYELLPLLGHNEIASQIDPQLPWYDEKNLSAAEAWLPQALCPWYPPNDWRASSPLVPDGRLVGATHFVAIAGVGLDAARYDPKSPEFARKVGITGYDWGSTLEEITDGLDKTIYLMQTAPGLSQPWLAGGGATVRGLNEADPLDGFRHSFGTPDGKPGTFALMANGDIRFIPADIDKKVLLAMATRAGGEPLDDLDRHAPLVYPKRAREAAANTTTPQPPAGSSGSTAETVPMPKPEQPKPEQPSPAPPSRSPSPADAALPVAPPPRAGQNE